MAEAVDSIAAVATPPGRGGIGIIRVSGPASPAIAEALCGRAPRPRHAALNAFYGADGTVIDRGIVLWFPGPGSYTGEDVVELHGHGGRTVMDMLLERVVELGARRARPGEFTERAFLNGRMDLVQAEAVADLIDSGSRAAARAAQRSLDGEFSGRVGELRDRLVSIRGWLEGTLDFPDEDIDFLADGVLASRVRDWLGSLSGVLAAARGGRALREGLKVVILGPPNAGKSSLLNRLAGTGRAIVDAAPGTTRDTVEESVLVGGIRMHVVDTAGLRESADPVETEGVRRALAAADSADVVILVTEDGTPDPDAYAAHVPAGARRVRVRNKIDLTGTAPERRGSPAGAEIALSAKTGAGVDLLAAALLEDGDADAGGEDVILARARHVEALEAAGAAVDRGLAALEEQGSAELLAEELRAAQAALGAITGEFTADDLLGEIFSRFCIGK